MKKPLLLLTFLLAIVLSCRKENPPSVSDCAGVPVNLIFSSDCNLFFIDSFVCQVEDLGRFQLEEHSKTFQPLFCKPVGQFIKYVNEKGESVFVKIAAKQYSLLKGTQLAYPVCENDSTRRKAFCLEYEALEVGLESEEKGWQFEIAIKTIPDLVNPASGGVGDFIEIVRRTPLNFWSADMSAVVSQRTLSYARSFAQENYGTIELLGRSFQDVISKDLMYYSAPKPFKFYCNAEEGLVGFIDQEQVLWRIDD